MVIPDYIVADALSAPSVRSTWFLSSFLGSLVLMWHFSIFQLIRDILLVIIHIFVTCSLKYFPLLAVKLFFIFILPF